jgi:hypothetical protein
MVWKLEKHPAFFCSWGKPEVLMNMGHLAAFGKGGLNLIYTLSAVCSAHMLAQQSRQYC